MPPTELTATFDPKVKIYLVLQVGAILCATFVGVLLVPVWALIGPFWAGAYFPTIRATLTDRALLYEHGIWFRSEMSIPLDKIQDVSLHHGPILDAFGLSTLRIETAGGQPGSAAVLTGVVRAAAFRTAVLERRDAVAHRGGSETLATAAAGATETEVLGEIRDSLIRIERLLAKERA